MKRNEKKVALIKKTLMDFLQAISGNQIERLEGETEEAHKKRIKDVQSGYLLLKSFCYPQKLKKKRVK